MTKKPDIEVQGTPLPHTEEAEKRFFSRPDDPNEPRTPLHDRMQSGFGEPFPVRPYTTDRNLLPTSSPKMSEAARDVLEAGSKALKAHEPPCIPNPALRHEEGQ